MNEHFGTMLKRLVLLYVGLTFYGLSAAMMVRADLGLDPWDVFHQGVAFHTPLSFGTVMIVVGALVLVLWIPLRQRPGLGTFSNIIVIGLAADGGLALLPTMAALPVRIVMLIASIALCAIASGMYIGAGFGPGPRDGLMIGLARRTGWSIRIVRTMIELSVLALGWLLGGTIGVGTVAYALTIGPLIQIALVWFERIAGTARPTARELRSTFTATKQREAASWHN